VRAAAAGGARRKTFRSLALRRACSVKPRCVTEQVATQGLALISWEVEMGTVDVKAR